MLVNSRLLAPGSKKRAFEKRNMLFDKMDFSLDDVYRSLSFFAQFKDPMLLTIHKRIKKLYGRETSLVYYDVTNYYFEISKQDELRRKWSLKNTGLIRSFRWGFSWIPTVFR